MKIEDILARSRDGIRPEKSDIIKLLSFSETAPESYRVMAESNRISKTLTDNHAEVHGQLALNWGPCYCNCAFCSFARMNGVFSQETRLPVDSAISYARQLENAGANAIYVMTTAAFPFGEFLETSSEIRKNLLPSSVMIANVGDQSPENAMKIKQAGYSGVYHAVRLREGIDTELTPEKRRASIEHFRNAGLLVGTCVEPVGPEHTNEELAEMILYTASINPAFSGAARRIAIPGSRLGKVGMISEMRMAQIVAVTRLAMPRTTLGNCTHEPCALGGMAGANLFWAEVGANPRDTCEKTENGRGDTVESCVRMFSECGWNVLQGRSQYFPTQPRVISSDACIADLTIVS